MLSAKETSIKMLSVRLIEIVTFHFDENLVWYLNSTTTIHLIHDIIDFIIEVSELEMNIESTNNEIIQTKKVDTILLKIRNENDHESEVHLIKMHYCLKAKSNLLSLNQLKSHEHYWSTRNDLLFIFENKIEKIILQERRKINVYSLSQSLNSIRIKIAAVLSKEIWHHWTNHLSYRDLNRLSSFVKNVFFISFEKKKKIVKDDLIIEQNLFCEICTLNKEHRIHSKISFINRSEIVDERLHVDIFDENETLSDINDYKYKIVMMNDVIRMKFSIVLKTKDEIVFEMIKIFNLIENQLNERIKFLRIDYDKEYRRLISTLNEKDIKWELFVSYAQNQNDVSKRIIKTIIEKIRILIIETKFFCHFWLEVVSTSCYLLNRSFNKSIKITSFEIWTNRKLDLFNFRMYKCDVYVIDYKARKKEKLSFCMWVDTLVDYEDKNQWQIFDEKTMIIKRDVVFNEIFLTFRKSVIETIISSSESMKNDRYEDLFQSMKNLNDKNDENSSDIISINSIQSNVSDIEYVEIIDDEDEIENFEKKNESEILFHAENSDAAISNQIAIMSIQKKTRTTKIVNSSAFRRSVKGAKKVDYKQLHRRDFVKSALSTHDINTSDNWNQAMTDFQAAKWLQAIKREIKSQKSWNFYQLIKRSLESIIDEKWIFKLKENSNDFIIRYKTRWIIKNYKQMKDKNYDEFYVLVVRSNNYKILLIVAAKKKLIDQTIWRHHRLSIWQNKSRFIHRTIKWF